MWVGVGVYIECEKLWQKLRRKKSFSNSSTLPASIQLKDHYAADRLPVRQSVCDANNADQAS